MDYYIKAKVSKLYLLSLKLRDITINNDLQNKI